MEVMEKLVALWRDQPARVSLALILAGGAVWMIGKLAVVTARALFIHGPSPQGLPED
jgi:hypothetical protein